MSLVSALEAPSKVVQDVITTKLFYDLSEANLAAITTQATKCSEIIKKGSPSTHLSSAEAALTKEIGLFEKLVKDLIANPYDMNLRTQLNPKSYQLLGRFQQILFAAHEAAQGPSGASTSNLKLDIDPIPEWVNEVEVSVKKFSVDDLKKQCETIKKPQSKNATHAMCVSAIMEFICAGTAEGKYRDWWIPANHEIQVYKTYLEAGQKSGGGGAGPYSSRLAAHADAVKDKSKYTGETLQKMDAGAMNDVLRKWGLPPGGQTLRERVTGYLEDPFFCDSEIFADNFVKLAKIGETKTTAVTVSKETTAQEQKLKKILAEAPPCPKTKTPEFAAKANMNPQPAAANQPAAVRGAKPTQAQVEVKKVAVRVNPFAVVTVDPLKYSVPQQTKEFTGFDIVCKRDYVYSPFSVGHKVSSAGQDGKPGYPGQDGQRGADGEDARWAGNNGEPGGRGTDGTDGGPGGNGTHAHPINLSLSPAQGGRVKISGYEENELSLLAGEVVWVQATGGAGGPGGKGGNGGPGGRGGNGANGEDGTNGRDATGYGFSGDNGSSGGFGGNGGDGGQGGAAGRGGPGGNGGNAGNVVITVSDPKLLVLIEGNSLGGDYGPGGPPGEQGPGGPGGNPGRGGRKGYGGKAWPEDPEKGGAGRDGQDGSDGTDGRPGDQGYDGNYNYPGDDGNYGLNASVTYQVSVGNKVVESSNVKFCPVVQGYSILDENSDGIFEPGTKITVSKVVWENCGGITFPAGGVLTLNIDKKPAGCPAITLEALGSKSRAVAAGTLYGTLPTVTVPNSGPAKLACEISTHMHLLEGYPFFGGRLPTIIEVRYPIEISNLDVPKVVAPGGEYKIKITVKNVSAKPIGAGELTFQATIAESGKQQFPAIPAFGAAFIELSYKAEENAELYSVIEWSAKMMYKGTHIENALASIRVAPIYDFDKPPQMALLVTGANMDLTSFRIWKRIFEALSITFDMWDLESMKGLSFHEETKKRYQWAPRYEGKLMVMSFPTPETLNSLDVDDLIPPLSIDTQNKRYIRPSEANLHSKNTGVFLLLATPRHLSEKLFAESPTMEKYTEREFTGRHAPFFTPSQYDAYKAIQGVRKKHEKKDKWHVVQVKHTVNKHTKLGAMQWSYGECEVRKMPLPKGTRLLNIAALAPVQGAPSPRNTSGPSSPPSSPPASPPSSPTHLPTSPSGSSLNLIPPPIPPPPQDNVLSRGAPGDIATTTLFPLPSRFVQAFVGTLIVLPPTKKVEFLVTLPTNAAHKWTFVHGKHNYTTVDVIAETIYYDLKHEFWENDKDQFPATTEYIALSVKSTGHENSQLVVQVILGAIYRLDKFTHRNTSSQKKMLKTATEQLDKIASLATKKLAKAQVSSKIKLKPLLFNFQFPTNGESKVERAERKAEADRLAKKTVLGRAKIGIFGKSK